MNIEAERERQFPKGFAKEKKKNSFHNFEQRDYDFDELERILLQKSGSYTEGGTSYE